MSPDTVRKFDKVNEILNLNDHNPAKLIPILHAVQSEYRYLPEQVMAYIATSLGLSPAKVYSVATFYSHFALTPKGKYVIHVCDGTACHVKGSTGLVNVVRDVLDLKEGETTTPDMLFTLETVSCVGACGLAPVMVVNEDVFGQVDKKKCREIVANIQKTEKEKGK